MNNESYCILTSDGELYHWGVKGMKWGVRKDRNKTNYRSTSVKAAISRRKNEKVDKGFKDWKENDQLKKSAIDLGKKANLSKIAYEKDKSNKQLKQEYKQAEREYKKALSKNTTYRKGAVKNEVGMDMSRKYMSEAKKIKKQMAADPGNKNLQKKYNELMSKHDIERANARRAPEVAANRSKKIVSIKRSMTMSVKAAAGSAAVAGGMYFANQYLKQHDVRINGVPVTINNDAVNAFNNAVKFGKEFMKYV